MGLTLKFSRFVPMLSHALLFVTPCAIACQAPLSVGSPRQEYWSGLPLPPAGDLLEPEIKPEPPALWADSSRTEVLFWL